MSVYLIITATRLNPIIVNFGNTVLGTNAKPYVCVRVFTEDGGCFVGLFISYGRRAKFTSHINTTTVDTIIIDPWH